MSHIFEIEKQFSNESLLTRIIKYLVLFIVCFIGSYIAIFMLSGALGMIVQPIIILLLENIGFFSVLITLAIIGWFIHRNWEKYKYGEVFLIGFDDVQRTLTVGSVFTLNNSVKHFTYDYNDLAYEYYTTDHNIIGEQRMVDISYKGKTVHMINMDKTAWCRHKDLGYILKRFRIGHHENYKELEYFD
jgi:hypothetical protein